MTTNKTDWVWDQIKKVGWGNTVLKYEEVGALDDTLTGSNGIGRVYYKSTDNNLRAFVRGGNWSLGADAGVFALRLNSAVLSSNADRGFRCAR